MISAREITDVFHGVLFYISIANMSAKDVLVPNSIIIASATKGITYTVPERRNELYTMGETRLDSMAKTDEGNIDINDMILLTKIGSPDTLRARSTDLVVRIVHHKPLERRMRLANIHE